MSFTDYPIETDPDVLLQEWIEEVQSYYPNWEPIEGSLLYRAAAAFTRMIAEARDVAATIPPEIFRVAGTDLHNLPSIEAAKARADTTWTMRDDAGYGPIPAGTLVSVEGVLFETTDEVSVPSGTTVQTPVGIQALDFGAGASGLGLAGTEVVLEESFEYVAGIALNGATSGGQDAEDTDVYLPRLRELLQIMSPKPILARDLATLAKTVAGVERATAIDLYDADAGLSNQPGHATVAVVDAVGGQVPTATKTAISDLLTGPEDRLLNSVIHIVDPDWNDVDITATAIAYPGFDVGVVEAAAEGALADFVDPSLWGQPSTGETRDWVNKALVSLYDVAGALDRVEGLDRVTDIDLGLNGGAQATADLALPGIAPLTRPGVINVTVSAP